MGHSIAGFIAQREVLRRGTAHLRNAWIASLEQGFAFLPLTDEPSGELGRASKAYPEFWRLTDRLARLGAAMSRGGGAVAYVETDYFGGTGEQAAMVWKDGKVWSRPEKARIGPISAALRSLGAEKGGAHDEFEAVGLARGRSNDRWVDRAREEMPPGEVERREAEAAGAEAGSAAARTGDPARGESSPFTRTDGHRVAGFIAPREVLREGTAHLRGAWVARLVGDLGFLPVTDELAAAAGEGGRAHEELRALTPGLARLGADLSAHGFVLYVETDYADGEGDEAAIAWHTGDVVWATSRSRDAVAQVLGFVDVEQGECYDELEAAGLDRYRDNGGWLRQARAEASAPSTRQEP